MSLITVIAIALKSKMALTAAGAVAAAGLALWGYFKSKPMSKSYYNDSDDYNSDDDSCCSHYNCEFDSDSSCNEDKYSYASCESCGWTLGKRLRTFSEL